MAIASNCEVCGVEFVKNIHNQKYCSIQCQRKRYAKRGYFRDWSLRNPEKTILKDTRCRARRRGLEFNLELADIVIPDICPVLGVQLERRPASRQGYRPSIDRIDSNKGYVKGNVQIISDRANTIKSNATIDELEKITKYMKENLNG